jgi:hypothetical protein
MTKRDKLYKSKNSNQYKELKRLIQKKLRNAYWNYIEKIITPDPENPSENKSKKFWTYIKHCRTNNTNINQLKHEGILHSNSKDKANILNQQFKSVFTKEQNPTTITPNPLPHPQHPLLQDINITEPGVRNLLKNIKPHKASGPDNISARVLKELALEIAPFLTLIFQKSYTTGKLPSDWKQANITPIYKKGEKYLASNYRPISLTCIASKVMEHIIASQIMHHANNHNILYNLQHGFRSKLSCETQLIEFIHNITSNMNIGVQTDVVVMDFSKAFDKVSHEKLLRKLHRYGICGKTNNWISDFLLNRKQTVVLDGENSDVENVLSGVPQGSVLGPCLFLFYINDIPENITSTVRLFADDTIIYLALKPKTNNEILQNDLDKLATWEKEWNMEFHPDKCQVIPITRNRTKFINKYTLNGHTLKTTTNVKYLGLNITSDLRWNTHINNITNNANKTLGFLRRNLKISSPKIKTLAYFSLVRPTLEYSSSVWDPYTKENINKIEMVQRRAARFVTNRYHNTSSVTELLTNLGWQPLAKRRADARLCLMYKIVNGLVAIPAHTYLIPFTRSSRLHHNKAFQIPHSNSDYHLNSFFPRTIRLWNSLPSIVINTPNIESFKSCLQQTRYPEKY